MANQKTRNPHVPVEPIHQPSLMGLPSRTRSLMSPKFRSLREIYERSNLAVLLLDSSIQPDCVFDEGEILADPSCADVFNLQVLFATSNASQNDAGALPLNPEMVDEISVDEALSGLEASQWKAAMDSEYQSLMDNHTWQLVPAPAGHL